MGIVLPDGNLNNPSLAWLRRWAEGRAKLLAVVSLPEETFRSSNATVKASLVFLRKFTVAEAAQWESAWAQAHTELDAQFDAQRNTAPGDYSSRILSSDDAEVARQLAELAALGLQRVLLPWQRGEAPAYPRQATPTTQSKPVWLGEIAKEHKKSAAELKKQAAAALSGVQKRSDALLSELKAKYKAIDEAHAERRVERLPARAFGGFRVLLQLRSAGQRRAVGGNQRILFVERGNGNLKAQEAVRRHPLATTGAGRLALQVGLEMIGAQQVMQVDRAQLVRLRREDRIFAGDDRFRNAVRDQANRAVARVDFREREIAGVGREHRALERIRAVARQYVTRKLDRDRLPIAQRAIDLHQLAAGDEHIAQRHQRVAAGAACRRAILDPAFYLPPPPDHAAEGT